jgi:hypothetical protein
MVLQAAFGSHKQIKEIQKQVVRSSEGPSGFRQKSFKKLSFCFKLNPFTLWYIENGHL